MEHKELKSAMLEVQVNSSPTHFRVITSIKRSPAAITCGSELGRVIPLSILPPAEG